MKTLNHKQAAEVMVQLFKERPELYTHELPDALDLAFEPEAVALLLAITAENWAAWPAATEIARATAAAMLLDFVMKLMADHPQFVHRRWQVKSLSKARQALEVMAAELALSHPGQVRPH